MDRIELRLELISLVWPDGDKFIDVDPEHFIKKARALEAYVLAEDKPPAPQRRETQRSHKRAG